MKAATSAKSAKPAKTSRPAGEATAAEHALEERLGYRFQDRALLQLALTHRSYGSPHNERLEFVGDAVVNLCAALLLFDRFPDKNEGELTQLRAQLVSRPQLAKLAGHLQLGASLRMSTGELRSGGRERDSLLSDAFEALMGAFYLDAGLEVMQARLTQLFDMLLQALHDPSDVKDPKTQLQEWLQSRHYQLPHYQLRRTLGTDHAPTFEMSLTIDELGLQVQGTGTSRRRAEQSAALQALHRVLAPEAQQTSAAPLLEPVVLPATKTKAKST